MNATGRLIGLLLFVAPALGAQQPALVHVLARDPYSSSPVPFSPDGSAIAAGGSNTANIWRVTTGERVGQYLGHTRLVTTVAFSPDGYTLASASSDSSIRLWGLATGTRRILGRHRQEVNALAFSRDGQLLASGSFDGQVAVWNIATGQLVFSVVQHQRGINDLVWLADGSLVSCSGEGAIVVWSPSGMVLRRMNAPGGGGTFALLPDGRTLAYGNLDPNLRIFDAVTGVLLRTIPASPTYSIAVSPDGSRMLTGGRGSATLWDYASGTVLGSWPAHGAGGVTDLSFSPDGSLMATSSSDASVRIWRRDGALVANASAQVRPEAISAPAPASASTVSLAHLGITVNVSDGTTWISSLASIGSRPADQLIGTRPGSSGTMAVSMLYADIGQTCDAVLERTALQAGNRRVDNALYAPVSVGLRSVEFPSGVAMVCIPSAPRPVLLTLSASSMNNDQLLAVRRMILLISLRLGVSGAPAVPAIRLSTLGLDLQPGAEMSAWSAATATLNTGPVDELVRTSNGRRLAIRIVRLEGSGVCSTAIATLASNSRGREDSAPAHIPEGWYRRVAYAEQMSYACLPLRDGALAVTVPSVTADEATTVRQILRVLQVSATARWGSAGM